MANSTSAIVRKIPRLPRRPMALAAAAILAAAFAAASAQAQGSRKDDIVFGPAGHPVAGATVRVCQPTATGTPCAPLATIYTDATLTVQAANPFQGDGIGNYHFYAPAGRYQLQISGPGISGTITYPDVILAADLSSSGAGNNISAFGLTLGGNLAVGGNATITGTLSTTNFNPGNFTPSSIAVGGNESVGGPRPRVDVTAYGAKADGVTDDTAAIQAAITSVCSGSPGGGTIYFPPQNYILTQTQLPSTNPIFNITCSGVHFLGGNAYAHGGAQFIATPKVELLVQKGASPNNAPVFSATNSDTFENLTISAYNQGIVIGTGASAISNVRVKNTTVSVQTTGQANNCPYVMDATLFDSFEDSSYQTGPTQYGFCIADSSSAQPTGLISMDFGYATPSVGCLISYIPTADSSASGPGNWSIRNFTGEICNSDLITIQNGGHSLPLVSNISLYNVGMNDSSCNTCALINLNSSGTTLQGVTAFTSTIGNGGQGVFIRRTAGTVVDAHDMCGGSFCVGNIVDASGNPTGIGEWNNGPGGTDFVANGADPARLQSVFQIPASPSAPIQRFFTQGNLFAGLGFDPVAGVMFSDRTNYGFNAGLAETTQNGLDISFAQIVPPTNLAGSATTGGSLAAASYYFSLRSTKDNCTSLSAPSLEAGPVVVGGANDAVNLTWNLPPTTVNSAAGYCLYESTSAGSASTSGSIFISGGSTASFTYTGQSKSGGLGPFANIFSAAHRFTPTSLGLGTLAPAYNFDMASGFTAHFPSYFDVTETAAPANPSAGLERVWADSTAHLLKCVTSTGASCSAGGGGGGSVLLNGLGNPNGNANYTMGADTFTLSGFAPSGGSTSLLNLTDLASDTSTGYLADFNVASGSTLNPGFLGVNGNGWAVKNAAPVQLAPTAGAILNYSPGAPFSAASTATDVICDTNNEVDSCATVGTTPTLFAHFITIPSAATAGTVDGTHAGLVIHTDFYQTGNAGSGTTVTAKLLACSSITGGTCNGAVTLYQLGPSNSLAQSQDTQEFECWILGTSTATTFNVSCAFVNDLREPNGQAAQAASVPNTGANWNVAWQITFGTAAQACAYSQMMLFAEYKY